MPQRFLGSGSGIRAGMGGPARRALVLSLAAAGLLAGTLLTMWRLRPHGTGANDSSTGVTASFLSASPEEACRQWREPTDAYQKEGSPEAQRTADDAEQVMSSCRAAVRQAPENADLLYQWAAAALESGHMDEFWDGMERAAAKGSCNANFHLGRDALSRKDSDRAEAWFRAGASCGDQRAEAELFHPEQFEPSAFPDYLMALYQSDTATLNRTRFLSASYVDGFYEALSEQYLGPDFDPCWTTTYYRGGDVLNDIRAAEKGDASNFIESYIYEKSLPWIYRAVVPAQGSQALETVRETARKAGHADLNRVIRLYHCRSLVPLRLVEGVQAFARAKKSLFSTVREVAPQVQSLADLQAYAKQSEESPVRGNARQGGMTEPR